MFASTYKDILVCGYDSDLLTLKYQLDILLILIPAIVRLDLYLSLDSQEINFGIHQSAFNTRCESGKHDNCPLFVKGKSRTDRAWDISNYNYRSCSSLAEHLRTISLHEPF